MRTAKICRKTNETDISLSLSLDGGEVDISTGCGFFDHMLTLFARHGDMGLTVKCCGDTNVDYHHSVEDIGICLGEALAQALGDKRGIYRYADIILSMDESLVMAAVDISGRSYLGFDMSFPTEKTGDYDNELTEEFFSALVRSAGITLHLRLLCGSNSHHINEAAFKAFGRIIKKAAACEPGKEGVLPSTKGML